MPSDVIRTPYSIPGRTYSGSGPGPIFSNIVLIDEIGRRQDAVRLFEVMEERQITVDS